MKKSWMIIGSAVLSISLTGCGANDNAEGNGNNGKQQAQVNQDARPRALQTDQGGDRTLRVNNRAEQHVERLKEVQDAQVIISNNNAYVAVRLANNNDPGNNNGQDTGTGTNRTGTMGTGNQGNNQGNKEGNAGNGQSFMENGMVNQNGDNGTIDGKGDAGNGNENEQSRALGNGNNNNVGNNNNTVGTGNGNTNGTGNTNGQNNRGTATRTNNYSPVSNAFEQKIADQVRKADNKIHKVYVSVNPDLYNTMNTYAEDIRADRDRDSLFRDFNNTINNFFGRENE
ncbi:YhcN/YlaJ family sporulation lipoprotein [Robertmurraya korlensis]|uniref:YhcN/YlaJ family sporulation lipoprotein n=1 Tax=Robertmurraya korlensis TaxID=519977 RepID=UPI0008244B18|nr:YhcN/YlaJ family sporulation lipoprotein [Robertmurraya korlensis]